MKYYIIAGEASGDLHGSNLIKAIQVKDPDAEFRVWGGDKMAATGASLASHYKEMSFMGFVGLINNLIKVFSKLRFCKSDIKAFAPDAIVFIDFSGFNLRIAKWAKDVKAKKFYYISPQVWASRSGRIHKIKAHIDRMFCILPFEQAFYKKHGLEVDYVGHPLIDEINRFTPDADFRSKHGLGHHPIIALLPGSRKQEIQGVLETMIAAIPNFDKYQFVIAAAPSIDDSIYADILKGTDIKIVRDRTYDLLSVAQAAIVTSGTATLETAILGTPQIVVYKGSSINYWIARKIITVDYISLVNLIAEREIVKELIQSDMNAATISTELSAILEGEKRDAQLRDIGELRGRLGDGGVADRVAEGIVSLC